MATLFMPDTFSNSLSAIFIAYLCMKLIVQPIYTLLATLIPFWAFRIQRKLIGNRFHAQANAACRQISSVEITKALGTVYVVPQKTNPLKHTRHSAFFGTTLGSLLYLTVDGSMFFIMIYSCTLLYWAWAATKCVLRLKANAQQKSLFFSLLDAVREGNKELAKRLLILSINRPASPEPMHDDFLRAIPHAFRIFANIHKDPEQYEMFVNTSQAMVSEIREEQDNLFHDTHRKYEEIRVKIEKRIADNPL